MDEKKDVKHMRDADLVRHREEAEKLKREYLEKSFSMGCIIKDPLGPNPETVTWPLRRIYMEGDTVDLFSTDGATMGKAIMDKDGKCVVQDDPMDIKVGKEFWFLACQFKGDPTVSFGVVREFSTHMMAGLLKPKVKIRMVIPDGKVVSPGVTTGRIAECYAEDLFLTRNEAEAKRAEILNDQLEEKNGS